MSRNSVPYYRLMCCMPRRHNRIVVVCDRLTELHRSVFWVLVYRSLTHRKLLDGSSGGKLAPLAISPDEQPTCVITATVSSDSQNPPSMRRPSVTTLVCPSCLLSLDFVPMISFLFCSCCFHLSLFVCIFESTACYY